MAIRIPSKNIYEKKNAKVRDNVIERIEVGAVEVVPNNEYDITVFNENVTVPEEHHQVHIGYDFHATYGIKQNPSPESGEDVQAWATLLLGYQSMAIYSKTINFSIPKNNSTLSVISKLNNFEEEVEVNGGKKKIPKLDYSVVAKKLVGVGQWDVELGEEYGDLNKEGIKRIGGTLKRTFNSEQQVRFSVDDLNLEIHREAPASGNYPAAPTHDYKWGYLYGDGAGKENGTISVTVNETDDAYEVTAELICDALIDDFSVIARADDYENSATYHPFEQYQTIKGTSIHYEPISIEVTAYGNTIGIDLKDKVVYIPDGDKKSKKVISFDSNELMQTTNHTVGNANDFISTQFALTKENYAKGKETITLLCSISDYYDYDTGSLIVSIEGKAPTRKMCFDEYDQVIPMVFGADGNDYPMSLNADGTPKVFTVLGTKIFYDGAVWQELYLQET